MKKQNKIIKNKEDFTEKYWENRWDHYLYKVADIASKINPIPKKILELGPHTETLFINSDTLDYKAEINPTYLWDLRKTPYPIKDKEYDLLVATQVWEHLTNKQSEAFNEVIRISKEAILSFPYEWKRSKFTDHLNINKTIISKWTNHVSPKEVYIVPDNNDIQKRIIYYFKF